jgi:hypothetical protein
MDDYANRVKKNESNDSSHTVESFFSQICRLKRICVGFFKKILGDDGNTITSHPCPNRGSSHCKLARKIATRHVETQGTQGTQYKHFFDNSGRGIRKTKKRRKKRRRKTTKRGKRKSKKRKTSYKKRRTRSK